MGDYKDALVWFRKALKIFEEKLGEDHIYTLLTVDTVEMGFREWALQVNTPL